MREGDCLLDQESSLLLFTLLLAREQEPNEVFLKRAGDTIIGEEEEEVASVMDEDMRRAEGAGGAGFFGAFREGVAPTLLELRGNGVDRESLEGVLLLLLDSFLLREKEEEKEVDSFSELKETEE